MKDFGDIESNLKDIVNRYNDGNGDNGDIYINPFLKERVEVLPEQFPSAKDGFITEEEDV